MNSFGISPVTRRRLVRFFEAGVILAGVAAMLYFGRFQAQALVTTKVFITVASSSPWTVPANWAADYPATIEVVGGGEGGDMPINAAANGGAGGVGGSYAKVTDFYATSSQQISFSVGTGGTGATTAGGSGNAGGNTWFSTTTRILAAGGAAATSTSIGSTTYFGGLAGAGTGKGGSGGGAAAGPEGHGKAGGNRATGGGGGGGSAGASATVGGNANTETGGTGGSGYLGTGAGAAGGGNGTFGGGGGGGTGGLLTCTAGGLGATSTNFQVSPFYGTGGAGGGGGGTDGKAVACAGGNAGVYGGGGGGGGSSGNASRAGGVGGDGQPGIIVITYTIAELATLTTQAGTSVTSNGFTANGTIATTGGQNATRRGFAYMVGTEGDPTTANSVVFEDGSFPAGTYSLPVTSLAESTGYRVRAYSVNSAGTSYGDTVQVTTTGNTAPVLTTETPTNISTASLTAHGTITNTGGVNPTRRGFAYLAGYVGDPTVSDSVVYEDGDFTAEAYSLLISGLTPATGYRIRAYASSTTGIGYGDTMQITTAGPPQEGQVRVNAGGEIKIKQGKMRINN